MLTTVLGIDSSKKLSAQTFREALNGHYEDKRLDYKSKLPTEKPGYLEIAEDIAAFSNTAGGLLVFGISDCNEGPGKYLPVSLSGEATSMMRSIGTRIEPFAHHVKLIVFEDESEQGKGIVVLEVPPSSLAPHAVRDKNHPLRFMLRNVRENLPMTESDIERSYRSRFSVARDNGARVQVLENLCLDTMNKAFMWAAIVPLGQSNRLWSDPFDARERFDRIKRAPGMRNLMDEPFLNQYTRLRNARVESVPYRQRYVEEVPDLSTLTQDGSFMAASDLFEHEIAQPDHSTNEGLATGNYWTMKPNWSAAHMACTLGAALKLFAEFGVWGDVKCIFGFHAPAPVVWFNYHGFPNRERVLGVSKSPQTIDINTTTEVLGRSKGLGLFLQEWFNNLCALFDAEPLSLTNKEGDIKPSSFSVNGSLSLSEKELKNKGFSIAP